MLKADTLVKTLEVAHLTPAGHEKAWELSARIEILQQPDGYYRCNVWFLESYRFVTTSAALNTRKEGRNPEETDRNVYTLEDALDFDELRNDSASALETTVLNKLESLFDQRS